jgi:hypothetical protein
MEAPSAEAIVALAGDGRFLQPRQCSLCTVDAVAPRLGPDHVAPPILRFAAHMVLVGAPPTLAYRVALAAWEQQERSDVPVAQRAAMVAAHFLYHSGAVARHYLAMDAARVALRVLHANFAVVTSPGAAEDDALRSVCFMPNFVKHARALRTLVTNLAAAAQLHADRTHPPPGMASLPPIEIARADYCVFCHGAHRCAATPDHRAAHRALLAAYATALSTESHARPDMVATCILAATGDELLAALYWPQPPIPDEPDASSDEEPVVNSHGKRLRTRTAPAAPVPAPAPVAMPREAFEEQCLAHLEFHDYSGAALVFQYNALLGLAGALAAALAAQPEPVTRIADVLGVADLLVQSDRPRAQAGDGLRRTHAELVGDTGPCYVVAPGGA